MARLLTQAIIEEWIALLGGSKKFNVRDIWAEIGIESLEGKKHLRIILTRLEQKGLIFPNGGPGVYRKLDNQVAVVDWQAADPKRIVPIKFPFDLHQWAKIYPKSVVIVAGGKNAGKTAFIYNMIYLNMNSFEIDLYNSETGPEQMNERFAPLGIPVPAPFKVYERYDRFADVIHPDHLSFIDYLDTQSEAYLVGSEIDSIFRKENKGVAVICLHKPPASVTYVKGVKKIIERDLAYGGGYTAKRTVLYISLSGSAASGKLKLVYVKSPAQARIIPDNMCWTYRIEQGIFFKDIQRYYEPGSDPDLGGKQYYGERFNKKDVPDEEIPEEYR